jgi:hypothetical protein
MADAWVGGDPARTVTQQHPYERGIRWRTAAIMLRDHRDPLAERNHVVYHRSEAS